MVYYAEHVTAVINCVVVLLWSSLLIKFRIKEKTIGDLTPMQ